MAIASAAAPSSRPTKPIPSPRVALTLTCSTGKPSAAPSERRIASSVLQTASVIVMIYGIVEAAQNRPHARIARRQLMPYLGNTVGVTGRF